MDGGATCHCALSHVGLAGRAPRSWTRGARRRTRSRGDAPLASLIVDAHAWRASALARARRARAGERQPELALEIVDARLAAERARKSATARSASRGSRCFAPRRSSALERLEEAMRDARQRARARRGAGRASDAVENRGGASGTCIDCSDGASRRGAHSTRARAIADELAAEIPDERLRAQFLEGVDSLIPSAPAPSSRARREGGVRRSDAARARRRASSSRDGKTNRAIARELGIGERTVEGYVASALAKLGFASRAQLAALGRRERTVSPRPPAAEFPVPPVKIRVVSTL